MAKEMAFKNGRISNFQGLVTLILTLDRVIQHTVHHASLVDSTYMPNFLKSRKLFVDKQTYVYTVRIYRTYKRTFETHFIRLTQKSQPKN